MFIELAVIAHCASAALRKDFCFTVNWSVRGGLYPKVIGIVSEPRK